LLSAELKSDKKLTYLQTSSHKPYSLFAKNPRKKRVFFFLSSPKLLLTHIDGIHLPPNLILESNQFFLKKNNVMIPDDQQIQVTVGAHPFLSIQAI